MGTWGSSARQKLSCLRKNLVSFSFIAAYPPACSRQELFIESNYYVAERFNLSFISRSCDYGLESSLSQDQCIIFFHSIYFSPILGPIGPLSCKLITAKVTRSQKGRLTGIAPDTAQPWARELRRQIDSATLNSDSCLHFTYGTFYSPL